MQLQRYLDVSQSRTVEAFESRLVGFANDIGFGLATAAMVVERPGDKAVFLSVSNTPEGFETSAKSASDSLRDPVLKRLKRLGVPFIYDQALYAAEGAGDLWEQQAAYGYQTGIAVALHLPGHRHFLLGFDRDEHLPTQDDELTLLLKDLQFLAVHAQDAASRLLLPANDGADQPKLTPRELEILKWTMDGKSAWAVGEILSVSVHTVNFHLRSVFKKLDSSSKHQAALKAMALGLL